MDQTQGKGLSHRDHTPAPCPGPRPWARDVVLLLRAPIPLLTVMCRRDLKQEREEGGREEARPDSLPSLPLPTLCPHAGFAVSSGGGRTPHARAQGRMCVGAGIAAWCSQPWALSPDCTLLSDTLPPAAHNRTLHKATPCGSQPNWGHPLAPSPC